MRCLPTSYAELSSVRTAAEIRQHVLDRQRIAQVADLGANHERRVTRPPCCAPHAAFRSNDFTNPPTYDFTSTSSSLIVSMNRSHRPFKLGLAFGKALVFIPAFLTVLVEVFRELRVSVVHEDFRFLLSIRGLIDEPVSLFAHPGRVGMLGCLRRDGFACFEAQKHQHVHLPQSPSRHRLH